MDNKIIDQINAVVDARGKAQEANRRRANAYMDWVEKNASLFHDELTAKSACQEAEIKLRGMAIEAYRETGDKAVAPGIGIKVKTALGYLLSDAMGWAIEHKLALRLDAPAFEKIAKISNLPFVTVTEEPQATIATELQKVDKEG